MELRRILAGTAAVWAAGFAGLYLIAVAHQSGGSPAWWYVAVLAAAVAGLVLFAAGRAGRPVLIGATVVLLVAMLLALLTIGVMLLPGLAAAVVACTSLGDRIVLDPPPPAEH